MGINLLRVGREPNIKQIDIDSTKWLKIDANYQNYWYKFYLTWRHRPVLIYIVKFGNSKKKKNWSWLKIIVRIAYGADTYYPKFLKYFIFRIYKNHLWEFYWVVYWAREGVPWGRYIIKHIERLRPEEWMRLVQFIIVLDDYRLMTSPPNPPS